MQIDWIGIDRGTPHMRAWLFGPDNKLIKTSCADQDPQKLGADQFQNDLLAMFAPHLSQKRCLPVLCCGMFGAHHGRDARTPYVKTPCTIKQANMAIRIPAQDPRIALYILPGVMQQEPADVMYGEEIKIAGFLAQNANFDGVICLAGPSTKWIQISAGEIVSFRSFMSGELFSILSEQSILQNSIASTGWDDAAFEAALQDAISAPQQFAARLFGMHAKTLLETLSPQAARAQLWGLLIGLELAGTRPYWLGQDVAIIAEQHLAKIYATALANQGAAAMLVDGDAMVQGGLVAAKISLNKTLPDQNAEM